MEREECKDRIASFTNNRRLQEWILEIVELCQPKELHLCDGSPTEYRNLTEKLVRSSTLIPLKKRENSFLARSDPRDVARVEECTFIASLKEEDCGPTNHWWEPTSLRIKLKTLFQGAMRGRTMYVIPFCMGPLGSPMSKIGVEITDSAYVVCNMAIMTRMGQKVVDILGDGFFVPALHSVGQPLQDGAQDVSWPCNIEDRVIAHFPETSEIFSYGSGYGGNALLGKKSFALRIASTLARREGWLAEHMLIMGVTNPEGKKRYFTAAFPSSCGKTNLAMMRPSLPGWKVECVGDDIAWLHFGDDGRLRAINPEAGFFGVAPGTSYKSNPYAMAAIERDTIFTNVALTDEGDVWWEGIGDPPNHLIDWKGKDWTAASKTPAAHPNGRFTAPTKSCPVIDDHWEDPEGVPIDAIIFGGRRSSVVPLVMESFSWDHGVFFGAMVSSETTAAAQGRVGTLRHDPFAMLPFCGYHMGDYFNHWLEMGERRAVLPKMFYVNWFRKDEQGAFLWPGFSENSRVLAWIFERIEGRASAKDKGIALLPNEDEFNISSLQLDKGAIEQLFAVDSAEWERELTSLRDYFATFGPKMARKVIDELENCLKRVVCQR